MDDPTVIVTDDGPAIRAVVELAGCTPGRALAGFTEPAQLRRWWGGELDTDLTPDGPYRVSFPQLGETLAGSVIDYRPGQCLKFTWRWEHEPADAPTRTVAVSTEAAPAGGCVLTVVHGPHGDGPDDVKVRQDHREGWEYFLPRLVTLLTP